ncbi:MAG: beta-galactosidase [Armatimonadota bacterium]
MCPSLIGMSVERTFIFCLPALLLFATALFALSSEQPHPSYPNTDSPIGINGIKWFHTRNSPYVWQYAERQMARMKSAGITWDRFDAWWSVIEPERGKFDWRFMDSIVEFYTQHGVQALPILCYSSAWSGGTPPIEPEERARFAEFVYRTVRRYKGRITAWEIWNEPNIPTFWKPQPSAEAYSLLLREAYSAAKTADPTCTVVGGATSMADMNYIQDLHRFGAWNSMDVLSIHPYSMGGTAHQQRLETILDIVQEMNRATKRPKPLWITEIGWTAEGEQEENDQAISLFQTYCLAAAKGVQRVFWFCLEDWSEKWGIVAVDGRPKKAYTALKLLSQAVSDAKFIGYLPDKPGPQFRGLVFRKGRKLTLAAWANDRRVRLRVNRRAEIVNAFGAPATAQSGTVLVGRIPVLVNNFSLGRRRLIQNPPSYPNANLLTNGDFEEESQLPHTPNKELDQTKGANRLKLPGWSAGRFDGSARSGIFEVRSTDRGRSAAVSQSQDAAWDSWPIPVRPGDVVVVRARVKGLKATGINAVELHFWNAVGWGWIGATRSDLLPQGNTDWRDIALTATVPGGAYMVRVDLISRNNSGTVLFDDVELKVR